MKLKEYLKHSKIPVDCFIDSLRISRSSFYKYCGQTKRPSYEKAMQINRFSGKQVKFEDLGWTEDGHKIDEWLK